MSVNGATKNESLNHKDISDYNVVKLEVSGMDDRTDFHSLSKDFTQALTKAGHHVLQTNSQGRPCKGVAHTFFVSTASARQIQDIINQELPAPQSLTTTELDIAPNAPFWDFPDAKPRL